MSKVKLYIAKTEDGFIAGKDGSMTLLDECPMTDQCVEKYAKFFKDIEVIIMGSATYDQIITELSPEQWPYPGKKTYVVSTQDLENDLKDEDINFFSGDVEALVAQIREKTQGDVWLVGGANLAKEFYHKGLIDEYIITTLPVKLGEGIELFSSSIDLSELNKISEDEYDGFTEDVYIK